MPFRSFHCCVCLRASVLGAFAKLRKATISFVFRKEKKGSHWTDFHEILYLWTFSKIVEKIQVSLKSDKNKGYFTRRPKCIFFITFRSFLLRIRNVPDKSCIEN